LVNHQHSGRTKPDTPPTHLPPRRSSLRSRSTFPRATSGPTGFV
jgi:hypothetical protein